RPALSLPRPASLLVTVRGPPTSTLSPYTTLFRSPPPSPRPAPSPSRCLPRRPRRPRPRAVRTPRRRLAAPRVPGRSSGRARRLRSEEHTSELQSRENLVCRLLLEKKKHDIRLART